MDIISHPTKLSKLDTYQLVLERLNRYITGPWWAAKGYPATGLPALNTSLTDNAREYGVRGAGMAALGCAAEAFCYQQMFSLSAQRASQLSLAAAAQHTANAGTGAGTWGGDWQAGYWAGLAGLAAVLVWPTQINTAAQRDSVLRMVEWEANRLNSVTPPVMVNAAGSVISPGDSKMEENNWNSTVLSLAAAAMPGHSNASMWRRKAVEFVIVGNAHRLDLGRQTTVNGRMVSAWTPNGYNVNEDYTVTNHDIVHPDYMQCCALGLQSAYNFALLGQKAPIGLAWNAALIYTALQEPTTRIPGAVPMYRPGSGVIDYPQGSDWGTRHPAGFVLLDAMVDDNPVLETYMMAGVWEGYHLADCFDMQIRPVASDRPAGVLTATSANNTEYTYRSRVEKASGDLGLAAIVTSMFNPVDWSDQPL